MAGELRECPLCYSANVASDRDGPEFPVHVVWCRDCGCTVDDDSHHKSDLPPFDRWNTRPQASARDEALEQAARALLAKLDGALPKIQSAITIATVHHCPYDGPTLDAEIAALRAALDDGLPTADDVRGILADHGGRGDRGES